MAPGDKSGAPARVGPPPELIERFLDLQGKELETRQAQLSIQQQVENNQFEYAKLALSAQSQAAQRGLDHARSQQNSRYVFTGAMSVLLAVFLGVAMWQGKDALALEIVKLIGAFVSGGMGGYALGRLKTRPGASGDKQSPE